MKRIKVAVLRGGPGPEHTTSLATGKNILENLSDKYIPTDIFVAKDGSWYLDGVVINPEKLSKNVDVVFNAMHGAYGEDGKLQRIMDHFGIKYTGSQTLASALGMNKVLSKDIFKKAGLKTPIYKAINKNDNLDGLDHIIFRTFPMPAIIKPASSSLSLGVTLVKVMADILPAIENAFKYSDTVIIEEYINGKEVNCGIIENFRGESHYCLLPSGNLDSKEKKTIQDMAKEAHKTLGLRHYSGSDFIVSKNRGVYILEVNTLPSITKESVLPKSLEAIGLPLSHFLDHVISLALVK